MSHIAKVACEIRDLDALKTALEKFGAELLYGRNTFKMWGRPAPCIHAIKLPQVSGGYGYEVGLTYKEAGKTDVFEFSADLMDTNITRTFGPQMEGLRNEYLAVVAEQQLQRGGWRVRRDVDATSGRLVVRAVQ